MIVQLKNLHVGGLALFPFIFIKSTLSDERKKILINHERIHLKQQLELLVIPFYFIYLINYFVNLKKFKNHSLAYRNIIFEKEAFTHEKDLDYLKGRQMWSFFS